ncbi:hypothetical protein A9993_05800 [Rahnella victoriana]|nr:hypothetical protein A9993_05800 [Rahnella victoriana]
MKPLFMKRSGSFMKGCETIGNRFHTRMCSSDADFNKNLQHCFIFVTPIATPLSASPKSSQNSRNV